MLLCGHKQLLDFLLYIMNLLDGVIQLSEPFLFFFERVIEALIIYSGIHSWVPTFPLDINLVLDFKYRLNFLPILVSLLYYLLLFLMLNLLQNLNVLFLQRQFFILADCEGWEVDLGLRIPSAELIKLVHDLLIEYHI